MVILEKAHLKCINNFVNCTNTIDNMKINEEKQDNLNTFWTTWSKLPAAAVFIGNSCRYFYILILRICKIKFFLNKSYKVIKRDDNKYMHIINKHQTNFVTFDIAWNWTKYLIVKTLNILKMIFKISVLALFYLISFLLELKF